MYNVKGFCVVVSFEFKKYQEKAAINFTVAGEDFKLLYFSFNPNICNIKK